MYIHIITGNDDKADDGKADDGVKTAGKADDKEMEFWGEFDDYVDFNFG